MKIKMLYVFPCLALAMASMASGCLMAAETANTQMAMVAAALQPVLANLDPKPEVGFNTQGAPLFVAYRVQSYKIHGRSMTGEVSTNAHDAIGPSFKGFVLRVHLQDQGTINQVVTPQTLQEPYWRTDLDVTPLPGTKHQIYWALSYGSRTDPDLLGQIRKTLGDLKNAPKR